MWNHACVFILCAFSAQITIPCIRFCSVFAKTLFMCAAIAAVFGPCAGVSYQETGVRQISRRGGAVQCNAHAYIIMGEVSAGLHIEVSQGIRYIYQWCCSLIRTLEVCIIDFMIIYTSCGRSI